jgi:hypothetical protein
VALRKEVEELRARVKTRDRQIAKSDKALLKAAAERKRLAAGRFLTLAFDEQLPEFLKSLRAAVTVAREKPHLITPDMIGALDEIQELFEKIRSVRAIEAEVIPLRIK